MTPDYYIYIFIAGALSLVGMFVSNRLKSKFKYYSHIDVRSGMTGKEVAESMLEYYRIQGVQVLPANGILTDHYNPVNKTVNLSEAVFYGKNVAAAAVAAHECGHAVQHDTAYSMLQMRSALVPVVKIAATAQQFLLIGAFLLLGSFPQLMLITIVAFTITTLFSLITLPVEFDASRRALVWLDESGVARGEEYEGAKDALWWAAMTYVSAALSSLVMLLYLILRYSNNR
jgi:Zn-dependent membrane protease YugP